VVSNIEYLGTKPGYRRRVARIRNTSVKAIPAGRALLATGRGGAS
jgi:hypothetical protein